MTEHPPAEVTAAQIARLAGVGRAAVSNWRKRHAGFPAPVGGTETSPTFSLAAVEEWLRAEGKLEEIPAAERLWRAVDAAPGDGRAAAAALVELAGGRAPAADLTLADEIGDGAFEALVARYLDAYGRDLDAGGATGALAELMAGLVGPVGVGATVYDPNCGAGALLAAAARQTSDVRLVGQTPEEVLVGLAEARLRVAADEAWGYAEHGPAATPAAGRRNPRTGSGSPTDGGRDAAPAGADRSRTGPERASAHSPGTRIAVSHGDALRTDPGPGLAADVVLSQPPSAQRDWGFDELSYDPRWEYGMPPRGESELAWVEHALARLRPGGTAALVLPPAVASRRSGRRVRAELLRRGAVQAVIALPAGSAAPLGIPLHLWLLRRPDPATPLPGRVLFVDRSDAERGARTPDAETAESIRAAWLAFQQGPETFGGTPGVSAALPVIGLLDDAVDLSPGRHVPRPDTGLDRGRLGEDRETVRAALARLAESLPDVGADPAPGSPWPLTTLGDLARAGALTVLGDVPLTEGDVLVPVLGGAAGQARVLGPGDPALGTLAGRGVSALRPDPKHLDPWFIAGFLRSDAVARQTVSHASTQSRMDLRKAPLPRLPLERQAGYGDAFRKVAEFGDALRAAAELGERLAQGVTDALAEGTVLPE